MPQMRCRLVKGTSVRKQGAGPDMLMLALCGRPVLTCQAAEPARQMDLLTSNNNGLSFRILPELSQSLFPEHQAACDFARNVRGSKLCSLFWQGSSTRGDHSRNGFRSQRLTCSRRWILANDHENHWWACALEAELQDAAVFWMQLWLRPTACASAPRGAATTKNSSIVNTASMPAWPSCCMRSSPHGVRDSALSPAAIATASSDLR